MLSFFLSFAHFHSATWLIITIMPELGALSRANKTILNQEKAYSSVFTLHHWSSEASKPANLGSRRRRYADHHNRTKLILNKFQESAVNFLFRWLLFDESVKEASLRKAPVRGANVNPREGQKRKKTEVKSRSSLLLGDAPALPDRRFITILKFIFYRWLTWANVFEFLLVVLLMVCCTYQCYELLEDYYSYPTYVGITKTLNNDFRKDLPAITLCNNNRISKESLAISFPDYNESHYLAMSHDTFYSADNFTLPDVAYNQLDEGSNDTKTMNLTKISWSKVISAISNETVAGSFKFLPTYDLVDTVTCANIWGDQLPCKNLKRIMSIQQGISCITLFHDSALYNQDDTAVRELESSLERTTSTKRTTAKRRGDGMQVINLDENKLEVEQRREDDQDPRKVRIEMSNMEVLRMRIDFRPKDYIQKKANIGGLLSVHSNSEVAKVDHIVHTIESGFWYSYYIERFDYQRLPAPYKSNCHNYKQEVHNFEERKRKLKINEAKYTTELIRKMVEEKPRKMYPEYIKSLRQRTLGQVSKMASRWRHLESKDLLLFVLIPK